MHYGSTALRQQEAKVGELTQSALQKAKSLLSLVKGGFGLKIKPGTELLFQAETRQVSSPQQRFTSEFGMGRSGSTAPTAPGKLEELSQTTLKTA